MLSRIVRPKEDFAEEFEPKAISIGNRKGGVGKTTLTTVVGRELEKAGFNLVLLDLDSQTDLTDVNVEGAYSNDLFDLLTGRGIVGDVLLDISAGEAGSLKIIPGSPKVDDINVDLEENLQEIVEGLKVEADIVLLDHPPGYSSISRAGYAASDRVLITVNAEMLSFKNLERLMERIEQVKEEMNSELSIAGVAVNKLDYRRNLTEKMLEKYRKKYPELTFENTIGVDSGIPNSQLFNGNLRELPWRARTLSQFERVAGELLHRL